MGRGLQSSLLPFLVWLQAGAVSLAPLSVQALLPPRARFLQQQQSFLAWAAFARVIAPWRGLGEISLETKPIIASF